MTSARQGMAQGEDLVMTLPLQIAPFPAPQPRRAILEQTLDPIDVVGRVHSRSARAMRWK